MLFSSSLFGQSKMQEYHRQSEVLFNAGNYAEALQLNMQALRLAEKSYICADIAFANMQVARMQYYLNNKVISLQSLLATEKQIDSCGVDSLKYKVCHNIGAIYSEFLQFDSALFYLKMALNKVINTNRYADISRTNSILASIFLERKSEPIEGGKYLVEAEKYALLSKDTILIAFAISKRGRWYFENKNYKAALNFYNTAYELYEIKNYKTGRLHVLRGIVETKVKLKSDDLMESLKIYIGLKDSIFSQETSQKKAEYEVQYESEKKKIENSLLQQKLMVNQAKIEIRNRTIIGLIGGILLIITFVLWRINVLNLRRNQAEMSSLNALQKEKERISRDLHDNVGGQLSYVLYALDGLDNEVSMKRKERIRSIDDSVRIVINSLRETIWAISENDISINDFADKLKVYTRSMFRNTKTTIEFSENIEVEFNLNSLVGLNLYRICQEIINNAFKYAQATKLTVSIKANDQICIQIADNGVGFAPNQAVGNGFGLENIKRRAADAAIEVNIQSQIGKGTTYSLLV